MILICDSLLEPGRAKWMLICYIKFTNQNEVKMAKRKKKIAPDKTEKRDDNYYRRINGLIDKWNDETKFGEVTAKCIDIRRTWNSVTFLFSVQLDTSVAIIPHTAFYPPDEEYDPVRFKYAKPSTIISLFGLEWTKETVDDLPFCVPVGTFALGTVHVGQSGKPYFTPSALVDVAIPILPATEQQAMETVEYINAPCRDGKGSGPKRHQSPATTASELEAPQNPAE